MATRKTSKKTDSKAQGGSASQSPEYREYLKRHAEMGADRPQLTAQEFEQYEDELLDLLALDDEGMSDDQIVRIQELEFLLIDAE